MKALFFSKRKDGAKSNSDSSLHAPPPSSSRRLETPDADAVGPAANRSASANRDVRRAEPWDGKCRKCRKLMSRCLCYEDAGGENDKPLSNGASSDAREQQQQPSGDKRLLFETLSGMHPTRSHSRLPIKMTQDRSRDRRMKETHQPPRPATFMGSSSSSSTSFTSSRPVEDENPSTSGGRFTRSCPDVKWRSSTAIASTIRLAHDPEPTQPRAGPPKNLLAYDNKKTTNRFNHHVARTEITATVPSSSASGNRYYITHPSTATAALPDDDESDQVWEL